MSEQSMPRFARHLSVLLLVAGAGLAGCMSRSEYTGSLTADYRDRHPIEIKQGSALLEIFGGYGGGALDARQEEDVRAFARDYRQNGRGPLVAYLPANRADGGRGLDAVRRALGAGGAAGRLQIAHYTPDGPGAAPIRLVFSKLTAEVPNPCGYENEEIVPTRFGANVANVSARNFGCTYQRNLAAQIADPRDLLRPRQEGPIDGTRRLNSIEALRDREQSRIEPSGKSVESLVKTQ